MVHKDACLRYTDIPGDGKRLSDWNNLVQSGLANWIPTESSSRLLNASGGNASKDQDSCAEKHV